MDLQLSEHEKRLLVEILEDRYKNLIREIARTDHREFKHDLQIRCQMVETILMRIKSPEHSATLDPDLLAKAIG